MTWLKEIGKMIKSEKEVAEALEKAGYEVYKLAWPNFLVVEKAKLPEGVCECKKVKFVEVKLKGGGLSTNQRRSMQLLIDLGFRAEVIHSRIAKRECKSRADKHIVFCGDEEEDKPAPTTEEILDKITPQEREE